MGENYARGAPRSEAQKKRGQGSSLRRVVCLAGLLLVCGFFNAVSRAQEVDGSASDDAPAATLILAARHGDMAGVRSAVERGEDINAVDEDGANALIMALRHYEKDIAHYLVEQPELRVNTVDRHGRNALLWAIWRKYVFLAEQLITKGSDVNIINPEDKKTPLIYVSMHPHMREHHHLIHMLVDHGADVNAIDRYDHSALFMSALNGHADCVEALLEHGAHVDHRQQRNDRHTSLHVAALNGHVAVVKALLEHGAKTDIIGSDGYSALDLARRNGRRKIIALIESYDEKLAHPSNSEEL